LLAYGFLSIASISEEFPMIRRCVRCAAALGLMFAVSACTNPYDPGQRAAGGALIGAGTGAAIGAAAGGGRGALAGALIGGGVGAATGVVTTPPPPQQPPPYYPPPPPPPGPQPY
jgi:hypothetical protein